MPNITPENFRKIYIEEEDSGKTPPRAETMTVAFRWTTLLGEEQKLVIDPLVTLIVREIFTRYTDSETICFIVKDFNRRELQTKKDTPFKINSLHNLMKNRKYIVEFSFQDVVIPCSVPAIVPKTVFLWMAQRMGKNKRAPARTKAAVEYLLTTKLFCSDCGRLMVGESSTSRASKIHYYYGQWQNQRYYYVNL